MENQHCTLSEDTVFLGWKINHKGIYDMKRLISIAAIATIGLILSACADPAEKCSEYGYQKGTVPYANCMMEMEQRRAEALQAFGDASGQLGVMNRPAPTMTTTTCRPIGTTGAVRCNSF